MTMVMLRVLIVVCALAVGACASTTPQPAPARSLSPAEEDAQALATLLLETARSEPERIQDAFAEMNALRAALVGFPAIDSSQADDAARPAQDPPPAPDLTGARSVMSAVHLASYRRRENAAPGWRALQARFPGELAELEPRLTPVHLGQGGRFLRLKAGPLDSPRDAEQLCARFQAAGEWCAVSDFTGGELTIAD